MSIDSVVFLFLLVVIAIGIMALFLIDVAARLRSLERELRGKRD